MNQDAPSNPSALRTSTLLLSTAMGIAAAGYFVGITDGVPKPDDQPIADSMILVPAAAGSPAGDPAGEPNVDLMAATSYDQMRRAESGPTSRQARTQPGHRATVGGCVSMFSGVRKRQNRRGLEYRPPTSSTQNTENSFRFSLMQNSDDRLIAARL